MTTGSSSIGSCQVGRDRRAATGPGDVQLYLGLHGIAILGDVRQHIRGDFHA